MKGIATAIVVACVVTHLAQRGMDRAERTEPTSLHETLPSQEALDFLSLTYNALVADYYWLRAINHFGDRAMHKHLYPDLGPFVRRVLALDPYYMTAYVFAGTALTLKGMDPRVSVALLEKGLKYRGDEWRIRYYLGFNYYYFLRDYGQAARMLAQAAKLPGAPPETGPLATRLAAEAGEPEVGLEFVDSVLATIQDPKLRRSYEERRALLSLELHLKWLNTAAKRAMVEQGRKPDSLQDLIDAGLITHVPEEPLGGRFFVDANGHVRTTNEKRRLRLSSHAKGDKR